MKSVLYILSNKFENLFKFKYLASNADFIIAVDGGLSIAKDFNLLDKVILAVGDFDTCKNPERIIPPEKIIRFPSKKDLTDTALAYNLCINSKKELLGNQLNHIFFSVSGQREDHFFSLIFYFISLMKNLHESNFINLSNIEFHNDVESIFILSKGSYEIYNQKDKLFSFFPLTNLKNLFIHPVEYKFPNTLPAFYSIGISNVFKEKIIKISFSCGYSILFIENKDGEEIKIIKLN
ncbi:MAG: thiamine diphosphokinase [Exilispira sp.]